MILLKKRTPLTRRNVLKNTAALAIAAPAFRMIEDVHAQGSSPARMINYFSCNGPMNESGPANYGNDRTNGDFQLSDWWKALEVHKDVGTFISHLAPTNSGPASMIGHSAGGQQFDGFYADNYSVDGPTIHHLIGQFLAAEGRAGKEQSVVWGLDGGKGVGRHPFSTARNRAINPETNPRDAWAQIFAGFTAPNANPAQIALAKEQMQRKQSMLDAVKDDCNRLKNALGSEGMQVLDDHCSKIREIELNILDQLDSNAPVGGSCARIDQPDDTGDVSRKATLFNDLIVAVLSCELTHVVAFQTAAAGGHIKVPGASRGHHAYTHDGNSNTKYNALKSCQNFYSNQMVDLVTKLKNTNDVFGKPLIESTAVLWKSELGGYTNEGNIHPESGIPEMIFGGGSKFAHNKYIRGASENSGRGGQQFVEAGKQAAQTLLAMKHHMGMMENEVGARKNLEVWDKLYS